MTGQPIQIISFDSARQLQPNKMELGNILNREFVVDLPFAMFSVVAAYHSTMVKIHNRTTARYSIEGYKTCMKSVEAGSTFLVESYLNELHEIIKKESLDYYEIHRMRYAGTNSTTDEALPQLKKNINCVYENWKKRNKLELVKDRLEKREEKGENREKKQQKKARRERKKLLAAEEELRQRNKKEKRARRRAEEEQEEAASKLGQQVQDIELRMKKLRIEYEQT